MRCRRTYDTSHAEEGLAHLVREFGDSVRQSKSRAQALRRAYLPSSIPEEACQLLSDDDEHLVLRQRLEALRPCGLHESGPDRGSRRDL